MAWYSFFKKADAASVVPDSTPVSVSPVIDSLINVMDYPFEQFKAYWETHLTQVADGSWHSEIRFHGLPGFKILETHDVYNESKATVEKLTAKLIKEKMDNFKR